MSYGSCGSRRSNGCPLPEAVRTHVPRGGEPARAASRRNIDGLANHTLASGCFPDQLTVRLKNQFDGFPQISAGFLKRAPLGIGARKFFDKTDVAFRNLTKYGRKFNVHESIIRRNYEAQHGLQPTAASVMMSRRG